MTFEELEKIRTEYYEKTKRVRRRCLIVSSGVIAALLIVFLAIGETRAIGSIIYVAFIGFIISVIVLAVSTSKLAKAYKDAYKTYFVKQSLTKFFTNLHYDNDSGIPSSTLRDTGMIYTGDRYHSNDLVRGEYKDVEFTQSDIHVEREYKDSDGDTHYSTVFLGRFMIFEFPKKFTFKLSIIGKGSGIGIKPGKNASATGRNFEKIEVESPDFNKQFTTYTEDGFEAFYILDPAFIDKIEKINAACNQGLLMCFTDNKLYIGLNNGKDSFEPPKYNKPINEQEEFNKINADINIITNFVDGLDLDEKLFA